MHPDEPVQGGRAHRHMPQGQGYQGHPVDELEQGVGFVACNTQVIGLLREALVAQARAALVRLPAAERGTSLLLRKLGWMLKRMGQLEDRRRGLWSRRRWPSCGQGVRLWAIATRTRWN